MGINGSSFIVGIQVSMWEFNFNVGNVGSGSAKIRMNELMSDSNFKLALKRVCRQNERHFDPLLQILITQTTNA